MDGIWLISYIMLWVVVVALAFMVLSLLRLVGQLHQRVGPAGALVTDNGPEIGEPLVDVLKAERIVDNAVFNFPKAKDSLMIFVSPNCPACEDLFKSLIPFKARYKDELEILIVSTSGDRDKNATLSGKAARARIAFLALPKLAEAVEIGGTPFGVWLDRESVVVAKGIVNHTEHLESMRNARASGFASLDEYLDSLQSQNA